MTRALYDDGPACAYGNGTGDVCVCGLGVGTAPCLLHPRRHSPYGIEATATAEPLVIEATGDGWHPPCFDPASIAAAEREVFTAIVGNPASEADPPRSGRVLAELHRDLVGRCR